MHETWKGFVFVDVDEDLLKEPHDLGCGLTLRKATFKELGDKFVQSDFERWSETRAASKNIIQRYASVGVEEFFIGKKLEDPQDWRHAVIECSNENIFIGRINSALAIAKADLRIGYFQTASNHVNTQYDKFFMLNIRHSWGDTLSAYNCPSVVDIPELKQIISYMFGGLFEGDKFHIHGMLKLFQSLDTLPDYSPIKVLGYFSVIEGLLSHAPEPTDRVDSIQRQLIRNINLLNNRLKKNGLGIPFDDFGMTNMDKVLKKLYTYRSDIAHGGDPSGSIEIIISLRKNKTPLDDRMWIHDWVRAMTKQLLVAAVMEPGLVNDLT